MLCVDVHHGGMRTSSSSVKGATGGKVKGITFSKKLYIQYIENKYLPL